MFYGIFSADSLPRNMIDRVLTQPAADSNRSEAHAISLVERLPLFLSAIVTLAILAWVLWYSRYGIDFTDESFYLVWMANPFNYSVSTTQFGFVYHPLYELLNGNISALRQVNILITFFLAWVLANVFLKTVFARQSLQGTHRLVVSGAIATAALASLVFAGLWLPTPSYNSLALQALLVSAIGLLLAEKYASRSSILGWVLIGAGGWLAFMAKPTTAAALGLCTGFYLMAAGRFSVRLLAISLATALGLLVLGAISIDGSISIFVERLKGGVDLAKLLGGGHTFAQMVRLDNFQLASNAELVLIFGTGVIFFAIYLSQEKTKILTYGSTALSIAFALVSLATIFGLIDKNLHLGRFQGLLLSTVPLAAISTGFALYKFKGLIQVSRLQWALALTFLILPYIYAFGTGNNYWILSSSAILFWVLAGLVFVTPIASGGNLLRFLLPLSLAIQLVTVALLHAGMDAPYRQPQPLKKNDYKLEIGRSGSSLILSKGFGQYIAEVINLANKAQFTKGTPMIDLSGQTPGILYAIGASNIGQAWTIGGYPGSDKLAVEMLKKVSCEQIAKTWLLAEPDGPIKISSNILLGFGANMAKDYEIVGTFKTAKGAGGYEDARVQQLLKPNRSVDAAITACSASRPTKK